MEGDITERLHPPCFKWGEGARSAQSVFCTIFLGGMCLFWEGCSPLCLFQVERGNGEGVWEANNMWERRKQTSRMVVFFLLTGVN